MSTPWFLDFLDLPGHADDRAVRRAYAVRLKQVDPAADPAGFARLREAYEAARQWVAEDGAGANAAMPLQAVPVSKQRQAPNNVPAPDDVPLPTTVLSPVPVPETVPAPVTVLASVSDSVDVPPTPPPVTALDNVVSASPTLPPIRPGSAQEHALRLFARFAARLATGNERDIRLELENCLAELRLQYIDAPGMFEDVLIDGLARAELRRRPLVFAYATEQFHWDEIGHLASLGPRGAWVQQVESQRMAWSTIPPLTRATLLSTIEQADRAGSPLPPEVVRRWPEVSAAFERFPTYLGLYIPARLAREWHERFDQLAPDARQPVRRPTQTLRTRLLHVPVRTWTIIALVAIAVIVQIFVIPRPRTYTTVYAASSAGSSTAASLRVELAEIVDPAKKGRGLITVTVINIGQQTLYLPRAVTPPLQPYERLAHSIFRVVDQVGGVARFTAPTRDVPPVDPDTYYVRLSPGQKVYNTFDLSRDYRLEPGRIYTVSYAQPVTASFQIRADGRIDDQIEYASSNIIVLPYTNPVPWPR